jgi:hypothetical protein
MLEDVVMYHHNPSRSIRYPCETAIIHLADIIAHSMHLGSSGEQFVPPLDGQAWELLGLQPSLLSTIEDQVDRQYKDAINTMLSDGNHD